MDGNGSSWVNIPNNLNSLLHTLLLEHLKNAHYAGTRHECIDTPPFQNIPYYNLC